MPNWLPGAADALSVISFFMTLYVLWATRQLRQTFVKKARTPELRKALVKEVSKLPASLRDWNNDKLQTLEVISTITPQLISLKNKCSSGEKKAISALISKYSERPSVWIFWKKRPIRDYTGDEIWDTYFELLHIIEAANQREQDSNWLHP